MSMSSGRYLNAVRAGLIVAGGGRRRRDAACLVDADGVVLRR